MAQVLLKKDYIYDFMRENDVVKFNDLARNIGISPSMMSSLLSGDRSPGSKVISKMLTFFGVTFETLFACEEIVTKVNRQA